MRNQAQTQQFEVSASNGQTFAIGFETGPTVSISTANDGIPDWWKQKYGLSTTDPGVASADPDGDGKTTMQEYILGTNPIMKDDGIPRPQISRNANNFTLSFPTILDRTYRVFYASAPGGTWTQAGGDIYGSGSINTWTDDGSQTSPAPSTVPRRFYRIQVSLP